jgi:hypothetical protein
MIAAPPKKCPLMMGDTVIYRPRVRMWGLEANSAEKLEPGRKYVIQAIQNDDYVVVEGYDHPGGGLHWTEFERCSLAQPKL